MDIARTPTRNRRRYAYIGVGVVAMVLITAALIRMPPASPTVDRATLWIDTVTRGPFTRAVRAPGTLVPEQIRLVSAVTAGRVELLPIRAGATLTKGSLLLELSNPDVQLQWLEAQRQLTASDAEAVNLRTSLETQRLTQQAQIAALRSDYQEAKRAVTVTDALDQKGLSSANDRDKARDKMRELETRLAIEEQRLKVMAGAMEQQLSLQQKQIERLRAIAQFQGDRVESMHVRSVDDGVLQEQNLELGQWVVPGQILAKIAQPGHLKAVLRVPETQAKDVIVGQPVSIDTRNGLIAGRVLRVDPTVQNGTVAVDVTLTGELPKGARPDLSVDGTVEIERLGDVLHVGRPAYGQAESTVGIFRLEPDGNYARRVNVKLGVSSVNTIEVVQGLNAGDKVIISDMSAWDNVDRVRIK